MAQNNNTPPARPRGPMGGGPRGMVMKREKPKNMKRTLFRLFSYIGSSRYLFFGVLSITLLVSILNLVAPALQKSAIDAITIADGRTAVDMGKLLMMLAFLLGVYLLNSAFSYLQALFSAKLSQSTVKKMRGDLFEKVVRLPIRYLDTHNHGDLMSRMTNDVENISNTVSQSISSLFSGVLTVTGCLVIMLYYSWVLTLVSISTIFLTIIVSRFMAKNMRKYFTRQQRLLGEINGHVEEMVTGYKTVVAFNKQQDAIDTFNQTSGELKKTGIRAQIFGGAMGPCMNVISNIGFLLVAIFGGWLALRGMKGLAFGISVGTIQAFISYSKQFSRPINEIANQFANIQTALAGAERVFSIMDENIEVLEGETKFADALNGTLCFDNVQFGYLPEKTVLKDFSLEVAAGQKIAIVGATGSGKTTVVNLLTRFYDIDSGSITVDGVPLEEISKKELRQNIAIVLQDTVLFSDTVAQNIRYGRLDATEEEIVAAAKMANADRFIRQLPDGYNTKLSEGGANLSQGQRQLLSIARAVLADPKILILDEATSSVDTRTEMHIQSAMVALMKNRTSLIIAHRLSTIRDADKIIVIDDGRVVEEGNHDALLAQKGCYYRLYQNQFAGIET